MMSQLLNIGFTTKGNNNQPARLSAGGSLMLRLCMLIMMLAAGGTTFAQTNRFVKEGNKFYEQQKFKEAAADYAKALAKDPTNTPGMFNLGNSLYQQKQFDSSRRVMAAAEKMVKGKDGKAAANYNIGNTYMSQQKWEDAIEAYKKTLRNNPQDVDAKYNLSYARQMMKKEQEQKDKNKDKDKDKKDQDKKDKDKQDQDKKDKDKDNKDKDQKDQKDQKDDKDKQEKEKQEQQGQPSKLTQQQAENLLNDMQQAEKKLQDKMKKEKGAPVRMEKDW